MTPELILVAHGTRNPLGLDTITEIAAAVAEHVGPVRTAFVDVLGPNPREVLEDTAGSAVVVPAFLASGYHVNADLPARVAESGHPDVTITPALGPDPVLAQIMHGRLLEVGWSPGDAVVMAAAGSSDPAARAELMQAATLLGELVGEVHLGFVATGVPTVADLVARIRTAGRRVFIASYLLAPGVFHTKLGQCGAHAVTAPLGAHPDLVALLAQRFAAPVRATTIL
ncbi:sirohydrochlorin ferrochelatase [Mycolicibacterium sp. BK556]|uniref:sirohydrochlorin chelatase n=1 Tax=Mycobacteriaceae TaxID=1762 RepID=UPI00106004FB|nr:MULTISPECIES: sirohydrochlorin chelatase [Mycobacteriaceae]MBB3606759.1 sirohydrochlorin ferrochelatase [Mycolicibacterium sp. BK556]MBB3636575.1 sirohydrochlorin ferrochelatase [Mycolicibacterium sp. BK607]MBB3754338.1 sirohydrochlorin ferrochelatase [Mycolicibacterium sp. BK634]TDO17015.1 sirohydrochlorin ferrochelatase [Mycobacterium sp. BK086]